MGREIRIQEEVNLGDDGTQGDDEEPLRPTGRRPHLRGPRGGEVVSAPPSLLPDDFMLLLCASLQRQIFEDENKAAVRIMAGDNVEICMNLDAASFSQHNPVPDFIHCR